MYLAKLFSLTLREAPNGVNLAGMQYLLRAGFLRQTTPGSYAVLPLGLRSLDRLADLFRAGLAAGGGQAVSLPALQSINRAGAVVQTAAGLARDLVRSHRQLPILAYQLQNGPSTAFPALDGFTFAAHAEGLLGQYGDLDAVFQQVFAGCELPVTPVTADGGPAGTGKAYSYLTPAGSEDLLFCDACGYATDQRAARFRRPVPVVEEALPIQKVATPHAASIEDLAAFLNIPAARTAKAVFLTASLPGPAGNERELRQVLVFAVVRGDMEVNETRLAALTGALELRPALEDEIRAVGAVPGYASPVGLPAGRGARVIVDELVAASPNLVAGANQAGYHLLHVNYGRDFQADQVAEIAAAAPGYACPQCGQPLRPGQGFEVARIGQVGALEAAYTGEDGQNHPIHMGTFHADLGRLLACLAEQHHDPRGLVWPAALAPYPIHLVRLGSKDGSTEQIALQLYADLCQAGLEPLFDDRSDSPGVKFNDADLIGLPLRLTVSERALRQGGIEFKRRAGGDAWVAPLADTLPVVRQVLEADGA